MISPQKLMKGIGSQKIKLGLSPKELFFCSLITQIHFFVDLEPFILMLTFFGAVALLVVKNQFLEPAYIQNVIERKKVIKLTRIERK